jgi:hypothetical protein
MSRRGIRKDNRPATPQRNLSTWEKEMLKMPVRRVVNRLVETKELA